MQVVDYSKVKLAIRRLIPPLSHSLHKGQMGKVAVVGGSVEYTGAPYYAAISTLKLGADLAFVICVPEAAPAIKCYSPELMVLPYLPNSLCQDVPKLEQLMIQQLETRRLTAVVVGPGLGNDEVTMGSVGRLLKVISRLQIPLIIDAEGLKVACEAQLENWDKVILTPNINELTKMQKYLEISDSPHVDLLCCSGLETDDIKDIHDQAYLGAHIAQKLAPAASKGPLVFIKGRRDILAYKNGGVVLSFPGSKRRTGGQGDILAGALGIFASWGFRHHTCLIPEPLYAFVPLHGVSLVSLLMAMGAAEVTRNASIIACRIYKRGMTAPNMIGELITSFDKVFPYIDEEEAFPSSECNL